MRLPRWIRDRTTAVILVLFLVGPVLGVLAYRMAEDRQREQQEAHLENRLAARAYDLRRRTLSILETLYAVRSFFDCSTRVTRDEFSRYTRDARMRHPAVRVMEWIPRVPAAQRAEHEQTARGDGLETYEIREQSVDGRLGRAAPREVYYPVCYAEPSEGNQVAVGFDLGSEATRSRALHRALESCEAVLSDPIHLVQDVEGVLSVLGFVPVFASIEGDVVYSQDALRGFVLVAFRVEDLVLASEREVEVAGEQELEIRLLDTDVEGAPSEIHASPGWNDESPGPLTLRDREIRVGGRTWRLLGQPTAAYLAGRKSYQPLVVGAVAFALWELLCGLLVLLGKRARDGETRKQARFVRSVLQSLSEGVVVADGEGRIQLANDAADRLVGRSSNALPAAQWTSTLNCYLPDAETPYPAEQRPLMRAIRGERVVDEDMFLRGSSAESGVWLSVSASPIRDEDEDVAGGVVVLRDITERKKSEAAIHRLSEAVEQSADAVFITDRRGRIEYVNAAFEETTGYTRDEILGQTPRVLGPASYTDAQYRNLWRTIMRGNVYRATDTTRRKDGQPYDVEQTITPMRDAGGRVTHFVSVARDVTEKRLRREREFEMGLAAKIQRGLFPQASPQREGFDIAGALVPAAETSGDYYDFVGMPDGRLTLAIGDVSGHGFGPALLMAETRAYLRSLLAAHSDLATVLDGLNRSLLIDFRSDHFVTLLLACIDTEASTLIYANAGHVPGYVLDADGGVKAELTGTGPILGIFDDRPYACGAPIHLARGDVVILLTDGVTETQRARDEFFGYERALDVVRAHQAAPAREIVESLYREVRRYSREEDPRDDTTLVVCKVDRA